MINLITQGGFGPELFCDITRNDELILKEAHREVIIKSRLVKDCSEDLTELE